METSREARPDDIEALKALVLVAQAEAAVSPPLRDQPGRQCSVVYPD